MRKKFAGTCGLLAAVIAVVMTGCHNDDITLDDGLPAADTGSAVPTVSYLPDDDTTESEPVTFQSSESTKRTAYSETDPELATTTATVTETTSEDGVSTVSGVPNVPIGEFTSTTPIDLATVTSGSSGNSGSSGTTAVSPAQSGSFGYITSAVTSETDGTLTGTESSSGVRPYSYGFLTEKQKYIYDAIISAAEQHSTTIRFSSDMGVTAEDYQGVYQIIYDDEQALFYIGTQMQYAVSTSTGVISSATMFYKYTASETKSMQDEIDAAVDEILAMITPGMTEYDKVKLFNDVLASGVVYDENSPNCRDIYGVFVDKKAICGGYSKAFSYLCGKVGIETVTVTGDADGQPHMWNKVKINGKWYNIDVTYAVATSFGSSYVRYDFFCVPDSMLASSRVVYGQTYEYPAAVSNDCDYFAKNGLMAYSVDDAKEIMTRQVIECSKTKDTIIQIKCAGDEVYGEVYDALITQKQLLDVMYDCLDSAYSEYDYNNVNFTCDRTTHVIKVFLTYV